MRRLLGFYLLVVGCGGNESPRSACDEYAACCASLAPAAASQCEAQLSSLRVHPQGEQACRTALDALVAQGQCKPPSGSTTGGSTTTGGTTGATGPSCTPRSFAPPSVRCSAATTTCLNKAKSNAEWQACFDQDANCTTCVNEAYDYCVIGTAAKPGRCNGQDACLAGCVEGECGAIPSEDCLQQAKSGTCAQQWKDFDDCWDPSLAANDACAAQAVSDCQTGGVSGGTTSGGTTSGGTSGGTTTGGTTTGGTTGGTAGGCIGTSAGVDPNPTNFAEAQASSGKIGILLTPSGMANLKAGDMCWLLELSPTDGQLSSPPGAGARCGLIKWTGSTWQPVQEVQLCEMGLSTLSYASAANVCDGQITGFFRGLFTGNQPVAGTFSAPLPVAKSQIVAPSCRPINAACSSHSQCCSGSCFIAVGTCN